MFKKHEKDTLNYSKLNEGINLGVTILKILFILLIVALVYITSMLLAKWQVLPFIKTLLGVISPLFIGILIAWLFDPIVTKISSKGVNRVLSTAFVYVVFLFTIFIVVKLMIPSVASQLNDIGKQAPSFINYLKDSIDGFLHGIESSTNYDMADIQKQVYSAINGFGKTISVDLPGTLMGIIKTFINGSITLIFGLIIGFYMLFDFNNVREHLITLLPFNWRKDAYKLTDLLNNNLRKYIQGTLTIMLILFVFQSIGLGIAGLKASMVFGLFCAITNIIPYVGPYIGGIPAILVGFSISPTTGIGCLISVLIAQLLESYLLQPVVMGKTMKLHPVTIMIGLLIFGHYFGIIGMLLATPIISVVKTIYNYFDNKYNIFEKIFKNS
ncbi:MAG: AI-2E family transporter [Bacilli bacterium]|nr:AI-2E family transporter [Bacilli bacterium]